MNKFKTEDQGGLPFVLNDFRWIDQGYREAFKGVMSMYDVADSVAIIISGCFRTEANGTVSISTGYISIGGEICLVPAHTFPTPGAGQFEYWSIFISYESTGTKDFQNNLPFETYEKRVAKVTVASSVPLGHTEYADTYTVYQLIQDNIQLDTWHNLFNPVVVNNNMGAVPNGTYSVQYKIDSSNFVHFRGVYPYDDPGTGTINILVGTLPVGYRPAQKVTMVASSGHNGAGEIFFNTVEVSTNGEVRVKTASGGSILLLNADEFATFEGG